MSNEKCSWIVVCISDTHQHHRELTDRLQSSHRGDILLHCGDITNYGRGLNPFQDFDQWLNEIPFEHKLIIGGNHEVMLNPTFQNGIYLNNQTFLIDEKVRIYGGSWRSINESTWNDIPLNIDILMTHNPPCSMKGFHSDLDLNLHQRIEKVKPLLSVFGHIHGDYGVWKDSNGIFFANASSSRNDSSRILNDPIRFKITKNDDESISIEHLI